MSRYVLSISSQVAWGPVGNSASVPALESLGFTVVAVPTVILSHHPGHGAPAGLRVPARDLAAMLDSLEARGVLAECEGVLTGYFAANEQIHGVARIVRNMKARRPGLYYLCDPVLGDDPDGLYVPPAVAEAIRDELVPLADCAVPNRFELAWLLGVEADSPDSAIKLARRLPCPEALLTSIPDGPRLATIHCGAGSSHVRVADRRSSVPHGTGDLLAGLFLGHRLLGSTGAAALDRALETLSRVMDASAGAAALDLRRGLGGAISAS